MKDSKLIAEWFWTDRWMGSKGWRLRLGPRGLYREMLTQAWKDGASLPNNPAEIKALCNATDEEWEAYWPEVSRFWIVAGDRLFNETQVEVYADSKERQERNVQRTKAATEARRVKREREQADQKGIVTDILTSNVTLHATDQKAETEPEKNVANNVTTHPPSPSPSPSPSQRTTVPPLVVAGPSAEQLQAAPRADGPLAMVGGKIVPETNGDEFSETAAERAALEARVMNLSREVAALKGVEVREALVEASRTAWGSTIHNISAASSQYLRRTAERLEATMAGRPITNTRAERVAIGREAVREIVERAEQRERDGIA